MRVNTPETFWNNVTKTKRHLCWVWRLGRGRGGYGKAKYQGRTWGAHRLAFTLANGPIPKGRQVNHSCDNRPCCNPRHLKAGTQKQNIQHAVARGRMASGDRQGLRRHPHRAPKGERTGSAKLTDTKVIIIRKSRATVADLATRYRVSKAAIHFVLWRRTWKHLP